MLHQAATDHGTISSYCLVGDTTITQRRTLVPSPQPLNITGVWHSVQDDSSLLLSPNDMLCRTYKGLANRSMDVTTAHTSNS